MSKHQYRISQSSLSDFYNPEVCDFYWIQKYMYGKETPSSEVMNKGLYFEFELIGGCRGGVRPDLPKSQQKGKRFGTKLKDERDLDDLVIQSKQLLDDLNYEITEVQPEWIHDDIEGHIDCIAMIDGRMCMADVKYTETGENDWRNGWGDLDAKPTIQPVHYTHLSKLIYGEYLPFYYWIFGKTGWVKFVEVLVMPSAIEDHAAAGIGRLDMFRMHLKDFNPQPANDYNKCRLCPFWDICEHKTELPQIIKHQITELTLI